MEEKNDDNRGEERGEGRVVCKNRTMEKPDVEIIKDGVEGEKHKVLMET